MGSIVLAVRLATCVGQCEMIITQCGHSY